MCHRPDATARVPAGVLSERLKKRQRTGRRLLRTLDLAPVRGAVAAKITGPAPLPIGPQSASRRPAGQEHRAASCRAMPVDVRALYSTVRRVQGLRYTTTVGHRPCGAQVLNSESKASRSAIVVAADDPVRAGALCRVQATRQPHQQLFRPGQGQEIASCGLMCRRPANSGA